MPKMIMPVECRQGSCTHAANGIPCMLVERRCASGECAHASRGEFCPTTMPDVQPEHRRQLPAAPAPRPTPRVSGIDLSQSYGVRVDRADGEEWTFSTSYCTKPDVNDPERPRTVIGLAQREAFAARIGHHYYGPLRVWVWQHRGDAEHYRNPLPENAEHYDFAARPAGATD